MRSGRSSASWADSADLRRWKENGGPGGPPSRRSGCDAGGLGELRGRNDAAVQRKDLVDRESLALDVLGEADVEGARRTHRGRVRGRGGGGGRFCPETIPHD